MLSPEEAAPFPLEPALLLALPSLWYEEARKSMLRAVHMRANSARKAGLARMSLEWVRAKLWTSDWKTESWVSRDCALRVRSEAPWLV